MNNSTQDSNDARSARRRLLKGGFAVPAVLTVASGSALAATSVSCVARSAANPVKPLVTNLTTTDTYLRVVAMTYLPNGANKTRSWWITYDSLAAVASAAGVTIASGWIGTGGALCVEGGTAGGPGNFVTGTVYTPATSPNVPTTTELHTAAQDSQTPRYYAVLFDAAGNISGVSFVGSTQTGSAVTTSCWTSLHP